uniref:Uncharacterized protein n=1 Tax=Glossina austeni TaxID=7395 RepID=A0A1A9UPV8_GLOAU
MSLFFTPHTHFSSKEFQLITVQMLNKIAYINDKLEKEEGELFNEWVSLKVNVQARDELTMKASDRIDQWADNCNRETNAGTAILTLTIFPLNASTDYKYFTGGNLIFHRQNRQNFILYDHHYYRFNYYIIPRIKFSNYDSNCDH